MSAVRATYTYTHTHTQKKKHAIKAAYSIFPFLFFFFNRTDNVLHINFASRLNWNSNELARATSVKRRVHSVYLVVYTQIHIDAKNLSASVSVKIIGSLLCAILYSCSKSFYIYCVFLEREVRNSFFWRK